jgi:hypothetical protein
MKTSIENVIDFAPIKKPSDGSLYLVCTTSNTLKSVGCTHKVPEDAKLKLKLDESEMSAEIQNLLHQQEAGIDRTLLYSDLRFINVSSKHNVQLMDATASISNIQAYRRGANIEIAFSQMMLSKEDNCNNVNRLARFNIHANKWGVLKLDGYASIVVSGVDTGDVCVVPAENCSLLVWKGATERKPITAKQIVLDNYDLIISISINFNNENIFYVIAYDKETKNIGYFEIDVTDLDKVSCNKIMFEESKKVQKLCLLDNTLFYTTLSKDGALCTVTDEVRLEPAPEAIAYVGKYALPRGLRLGDLMAGGAQGVVAQRKHVADQALVADTTTTPSYTADAQGLFSKFTNSKFPCFFDGCAELRESWKADLARAEEAGCSQCERNKLVRQYTSKVVAAWKQTLSLQTKQLDE